MKYLFYLYLCILLFSCKKDPVKPEEKPIAKLAKGMYVLNEGLINMNNASLTYYDYSDSLPRNDYFNLINGRKLGDTGNDMAHYGDKIYIVVSVSSQIEVMNANTGKSIKQIPVFNKDVPQQPRKLAFYKNLALVCNFDGTVTVIDTFTLEIIKNIKVGRNPDGIAVANDKAYVANSGGLDAPNYDRTISVIDLLSLTEIKKIEVEINPYNIVNDSYGDLYVISRGDYEKVKMKLQVIDSKTDELKFTFPGIEALNLAIMGDTAYVYYFDYNAGSGSKIMTLNVKNETVISDNFISDGTKIQTVYGIAVDTSNSRIFLSDAKGFVNTGEVFCFNTKGNKLFSFKAGLNPGKMVFVY